ncbi:MAG TPA: hypothetical protein VMC02_04735 [Steroidobacteraceae bacterium]|nr:hypothetical protein [Steroidobacteraceae bacterium]
MSAHRIAGPLRPTSYAADADRHCRAGFPPGPLTGVDYCPTAPLNWQQAGFRARPLPVLISAPRRLYRVWGGASREIGEFFTFDRPRTRTEAEGLFAVWEWGNACRFISAFVVLPGATIFVGRVHPGDFHGPELGAPGSQVFIGWQDVGRYVRKVGPAVELADDLATHVVVPNPDPGRAMSS